MATLLSNPYASQAASHYSYVAQQPQGPPSPPMEDSSKCSLPSISNLIDLADQGSPTSETSPQSQQMQQAPSQQQDFNFNTLPSRPSTRPSSSHYASNPMTANLRGGVLPPTPPMTSEASFGYDSPSVKSMSQLPPAAPMPSIGNYYFEATPPPQQQPYASHDSTPEPSSHMHNQSHSQSHSYRQPTYSPHPLPHSLPRRHASHTPTVAHRHLPHHRNSLPMMHTNSSSSTASSYSTSAAMAAAAAAAAAVQQQQQQPPITYSSPAYLAQPTPLAPAATPYYQSMQAAPPQQISGLYYQRPLPQAFPPMSVVQPSPWQHHHYISPAAAAAFPQSQDRYICPTCSKAFSRPSSLRIHSHSHTGEKPFKCPHAGCGKAFSVRSNMKRHERGCHNYDSAN